MTEADAIHPLAARILTAFAGVEFFRCVRLSRELATSDPRACLAWAYKLIEFRCAGEVLPPHADRAFELIHTLRDAPSADRLRDLDLLTEQCWNSGIGEDMQSRLPRAIARLGWSTMGFVCVAAATTFSSDRMSISSDNGLGLLWSESGTAIDMLYNRTTDDRYVVATTFTAAMRGLQPVVDSG